MDNGKENRNYYLRLFAGTFLKSSHGQVSLGILKKGPLARNVKGLGLRA